MLRTLEKSWPIISIVFILAILASLFFWPATTRLLSLIVMVVGLAAIITFTTRRHVQAQKQGKITRQMLARNIIVDVTGIFITMAAVILVAGKAGAYVGQAAGRAWGVTAGIIASLAAGLVVGFGVSLLARWGVALSASKRWGKLTKPRRSTPAGNVL